MNATDALELAKAFGPVAGGVLFVIIIVFKNGFFKVLLRDETGGRAADEMTKLRQDIAEIQEKLAILQTQMADLNTKTTVLYDRWDRTH
jgi:uncharacterized protein YlxW (UPF0749 family)